MDWVKVDHCQFIQPQMYISPIRNATVSAEQCRIDMDSKPGTHAGINVVPTHNPDVVPATVARAVETVNPVCEANCFDGTWMLTMTRLSLAPYSLNGDGSGNV